MKKIRQYAGVMLIVLGTLALVATRLKALNSNNTLLLAGLLMIVVGIVVHIRSIKHASEY